MKNHKNNYKSTVAIIMVIILLLVILALISYYRNVEVVTDICLSFLIACTTGVIIEIIHGSKEKDSIEMENYKEELKQMKYKIIGFRKRLNNLFRNRNRYNFFNQADRLIEEASKINEQIKYLYENSHKKSLIRKFLNNQELNLTHKITSIEEIREDIVNMSDKRAILKKISRYNHNLDSILYNINREFGIK